MKRIFGILLIGSCLFMLTSQRSSAQWLQVYKFELTSIESIVAGGSDFYLGTKAPLNFGNGIVMRSVDGGSWQTLNNQGWPERSKTPYHEGISVKCLAVSGMKIIAGTWNSSILVSADGGRSWTAPLTGLPKNQYASCLSVKGTDIFAGFWDESVFLSKDGGVTWTAANAGLPQDRETTCLVVSGPNIFVGTYSRGIFLSADNGTTWTEASAGLPRSPGYPKVNCLVVSGANVFAACGGVFRSSDNGKSWTGANSGLPPGAGVTSLTAAGHNLFAGTTGNGVFVSADGGASWKTSGPGMTPGTSIWKLAANDSYLLACTLEEVWRLPLSELSPGGGPGPKPSGGPVDSATLKSLIANGDRAYQGGDYANAIVFYSKAIELDPKASYAWLERGWSYVRLGGRSSYDKALIDVNKALELSPADKSAYFLRGEICRNLAYFALDKKNKPEADGLLTKALADYQIALDANPESPVIARSIGHAYFAKGDLDRALEAYSNVLKKDLYNREIADDLNRVFEAYDRDQRDFDCGDFKDTWYLAGDFQARKKHGDQAVKCYSKAIELGRADRWAYTSRARAYLSIGKYAEALADADQEVKLGRDYYAYSVRAEILQKKGDLDRAIADYSKAIDLAWKKTSDPDEAESRARSFIDYRIARAGLYEQKQSWNKAIDDYKEAAKFMSDGPRKARLLYQIGSAYQKKGDAGNAQKYFRQAEAMDPKLKSR